LKKKSGDLVLQVVDEGNLHAGVDFMKPFWPKCTDKTFFGVS
jgi:hypothetical protein